MELTNPQGAVVENGVDVTSNTVPWGALQVELEQHTPSVIGFLYNMASQPMPPFPS